MLTISKIKSGVVATLVATGMLATDASMLAAKADPYGKRPYGYDRHVPPPPPHIDHRRVPAPPYHHRKHRDHTGDAVAATVLGVGALIVGAAIADAARRNQQQQRYEGDDD